MEHRIAEAARPTSSVDSKFRALGRGRAPTVWKIERKVAAIYGQDSVLKFSTMKRRGNTVESDEFSGVESQVRIFFSLTDLKFTHKKRRCSWKHEYPLIEVLRIPDSKNVAQR